LFWGYPRNKRMLLEGMLFRKNKLERVLAFGKEKLSGGIRVARKRHLQVDDFPAYYYRSLFVSGAEQWLPELFEKKAGEAFFFQKIYTESTSHIDEQQVMNVLRKMEVDLHLQRILLKVDRASMYHSLEVRVPLLSNDIIDYSTSLSYQDCVQQGQGKYNLKKLLIEKSNEQLVMQPKKGFIIPIGKWLRNELRTDVHDRLLNMPGELSILFNRKQLQKLLDEHMNGTADWGWLIWSVYALVNWHDCHRNKVAAF
jgi:asparagine synthase (glutamine-hydrolysing)